MSLVQSRPVSLLEFKLLLPWLLLSLLLLRLLLLTLDEPINSGKLDWPILSAAHLSESASLLLLLALVGQH